MIRVPLQTVAQYAGGTVEGCACDPRLVSVAGVSKDTRTMEPGNLYVSLIGERFNGHDYAGAALRRGASAVLWQADQGTPPQGPAVVVPDTLLALQRLAFGYRKSLPVRVIGITGSNGKTTTKDMTAAVLARAYKVCKTEGNLNNHIGLPLTLLSLSPDTEYAVLEMGMSGRGEIGLLSGIACPDMAIITNIGEAHLLQLGSRDAIAQAKLEIGSGLAPGGTFIVPGDEPLIDRYLNGAPGPADVRVIRFGPTDRCDVRRTSVQVGPDVTRFRTADSGIEYVIPMLGEHNANNALAAIAAGRSAGVDEASIAEGLRTFAPVAMRIEQVQGKGGTMLWNDAYNANPTSMKAALALLADVAGCRRKFAVLGDMLELGADERQYHVDIGRTLPPESIDFVFACGTLGRLIAETASVRFGADRARAFDSKEQLAECLASAAQPGDLILVKASRGMELEYVIETMRATP